MGKLRLTPAIATMEDLKRIEDLEKTIVALTKKVEFLDAQLKLTRRTVYSQGLALNLNTKVDRRTAETMTSIQKAISDADEAKIQVRQVKSSQKTEVRKSKRTSIAMFGFIAILTVFYVRGEIQAGAVVEAVIALSAAVGWGVFSATKA